MKMKSIPQFDRPREKLEKFGPEILKDEEVLAIILRTGYKGKDVLSIAKEIIKKYSYEIFDMDYKSISKIKGIGKIKALEIVAIKEIMKRIQHNTKKSVTQPEDVVSYLWEIKDRKKECFLCLYFNVKNILIHKEFISVGTLTDSLVHPREVFGPAFEKRACSIIIAHNHPSGDVNPSQDDIKLTHKLIEAGKILGIQVLDHIIISGEKKFSFKNQNLI